MSCRHHHLRQSPDDHRLRGHRQVSARDRLHRQHGHPDDFDRAGIRSGTLSLRAPTRPSPAGTRTCTVAATDVLSATATTTITFAVGPTITGLEATGRSAPGTAYTDNFTVTPTTSTVLASGAGCTLSGTAGSYTLTVTRADAGTRTCTISAVDTLSTTASATIRFGEPTLDPSLGVPTWPWVTCSADGTEFTVNWAGVTAATGYEAEEDGGNLAAWTGAETSFTATSRPGESYRVRIRSTAAGYTVSSWSSWAGGDCPVPAPTGLSVVCQASGKLAVSWNAVSGASQYTATITSTKPPPPPVAPRKLTRNLVRSSPNSEPPNSFELDATADWTYAVVVKAQVNNTWSADAASVSDTCEAIVPPAPAGVTASCSSGTLTVTWDSAGAGLAKATTYKPRIFIYNTESKSWVMSNNWTANAAGHDTTTATIPATGEDDLPTTGIFQVKVKAANTAGDSPYSDPVDATCGPPGPITGLKCTAITKDQITIEWSQAIGADTYTVTGRSGSGRGAHIVYGEQGTGDFTTDSVSDLRDDASYVLTVVATNTEGTSRALVNCRTLDDNWLSAECAGDGILDINWNNPPDNAQTYTITVVASDAIQPSSRTNTLASSTTRWTILADPEGEYQVSVMSRNRFGGPIYSQTKAVECPKLSTPEKTWLSVSPNIGRTIPGLSAEFTYAPELHLVTNVPDQARNCSKTGNTWICKEHWTERDLVVEVKEEWLELLRVYGVEILETEGLTGIEREVISTVLDASLGAVIAIIGKSKKVQKLLAKLKLDSNGVTKVVLGVVRRLSPGDFITGLFAEGIAYLEIPAPGCLPGVNDWTYEKNVAHKTSRSVGELTVERRYTFHYCVENES